MEQNSQPQIHLILPKVGDQEYHFCLKTPEEFTKAAQALFDRQSLISAWTKKPIFKNISWKHVHYFLKFIRQGKKTSYFLNDQQQIRIILNNFKF